ncbi:MAG TPA: hypothetical protein VGB84_06745 [Arachidicoccus sp.]
MNRLLLQFFAINKRASLPGVGTFVRHAEKSEDNFGNKTIAPQSDKIIFLEETDNDTKEKFELFVSCQSQKSEQQFLNYYQLLVHQLKIEGRLNIDGLGILLKENEKIHFQQTFSTDQFFPIVAAQKVIRSDAEHIVRVGEEQKTSTQMREALLTNDSKNYWWVYVLIVLLIAGAGYLLYRFYFQKG